MNDSNLNVFAQRCVAYMAARALQLMRLGLVTPALLFSACDADSARQPVTLTFNATFGSDPFVCGSLATGLGATGDQSLTIRDVRLYVHDVRLVNASGDEVPLELDENPFQHETVAYLDFANSNDVGCEGNPETRTVIEGTAPEGDYVGVRFTVGLPSEVNHSDASIASSPLNITDMFWSWQSGYKFIRIDGASAALPDWRFHLGSTGCVGNPALGVVTTCAATNDSDVELADMDLVADSIRLDVAELLSDTDLDTNAVDTPPGCMSNADDPDCTPYFEALGIAHGASPAGSQRVFSVN